ncbi:hypothetical protein M0R72_19470 [Candidatus Pacearchaeota archaeon]|jgi:hypothetical protein|nr:hypothetical protein [Candidatus Pacearchaeota archaeon]
MPAIYRIVGPSIGGYRYDMGREGPITEVSNDGNIMLGNMAFIYPPSSLEEVA